MASKYSTEDEQETEGITPQSLFTTAKHLALLPINTALSRPARRAYLTTFLFAITAFLLLCFAVTAYTLFYLSYIPRIGFERVIHLQFDHVYTNRIASPYPHGTVSLAPEMVGAQAYDIAIEMVLPRTPANTDAGNFMVEVMLHGPSPSASQQGTGILDTIQAGITPSSSHTGTALATSRRPAILPYRSPLLDYAYKLTELPYYLFNLRHESETLRIPVLDRISFPKDRRSIPSTLKLELQSTKVLQVYTAKAIFRARFTGLRWLMYNHRIISAFVFVGGFWMTECLFAGLAYAIVVFTVLPRTKAAKAETIDEVAENVKQENDVEDVPMSDTDRTFPSQTGKPVVRYQSPGIKREEGEGNTMVMPEQQTMEADDEDEDADMFIDSGLGTSMESSVSAARRDSMRRRRGRPGIKEEG